MSRKVNVRFERENLKTLEDEEEGMATLRTFQMPDGFELPGEYTKREEGENKPRASRSGPCDFL